MSFISNLISFLFAIGVIFFCQRYDFLYDKKIEKHKKFINKKKNYILGGIIILFFLLFRSLTNNDYLDALFYLCIFAIGFSSDLKILNNPKVRFIIQFFTIFIFIALFDLRISSTRMLFLDNLIENNISNYLFVSFCLMVLINGSNFVDGINILLVSYFILILSLISINFHEIINDIKLINDLIFILSLFFLFNIFGLIILGDSGAYLISIFIGVFLINFSNLNENISPFFIILLLWYPCFELLFSMTRRYLVKKDSYYPDTGHLHQILYKAISSKNKYKQNVNHFISSLLILTYNLFSFLFGFKYFNHTKNLILIILINLLLYIFFYFFLKKKYKY